MAEKYDAPVQLNDGVHWIGYTDTDSVFRTNAYLIESGNEIALIDAGSAVYFDSMFNQIEKLIDVNKIEYFIQHHQDPDLCASLPFWEKIRTEKNSGSYKGEHSDMALRSQLPAG